MTDRSSVENGTASSVLSARDRKRLIDLLEKLPAMGSEQSRRLLLENAGLGQLTPHIHLTGNPHIATSSIVNYLAKYGNIVVENESVENALGLFLKEVQKSVGLQDRQAIDRFLEKCVATSPATSHEPTSYVDLTSPQPTLEYEPKTEEEQIVAPKPTPENRTNPDKEPNLELIPAPVEARKTDKKTDRSH